jgi:hypothetical protein
MASSGKKKTTMAKLQRESRLREKRHLKAVKKEARKRAAAEPAVAPVVDAGAPDESTAPAEA